MTSRDRQRTLVEILTELDERDPEIEHAASLLSLKAGRLVAQPSVLACSTLILISGRIQLIYDNPNGPRLTLATLSPGTVFGAGAQPGRLESGVSANALTDCTVWMVPEPQAQKLEQDYIAVRLGTLQALGSRVAAAEHDRMSGLSSSRDGP